MNRFNGPQSPLTLTLLAYLVLTNGCKTTGRDSSLAKANEQEEYPGVESPWQLLPQLQNVLSQDLVEQTGDPKSPEVRSHICIAFDRTAEQGDLEKIQAKRLQLWLEPAEFCGEAEDIESPSPQHQFLGIQAREIKDPSEIAWTIYLEEMPIGNASIDNGTGLPLIQSLCSGPEYGKACKILATPQFVRIVPSRSK